MQPAGEMDSPLVLRNQSNLGTVTEGYQISRNESPPIKKYMGLCRRRSVFTMIIINILPNIVTI